MYYILNVLAVFQLPEKLNHPFKCVSIAIVSIP